MSYKPGKNEEDKNAAIRDIWSHLQPKKSDLCIMMPWLRLFEPNAALKSGATKVNMLFIDESAQIMATFNRKFPTWRGKFKKSGLASKILHNLKPTKQRVCAHFDLMGSMSTPTGEEINRIADSLIWKKGDRIAITFGTRGEWSYIGSRSVKENDAEKFKTAKLFLNCETKIKTKTLHTGSYFSGTAPMRYAVFEVVEIKKGN